MIYKRIAVFFTRCGDGESEQAAASSRRLFRQDYLFQFLGVGGREGETGHDGVFAGGEGHFCCINLFSYAGFGFEGAEEVEGLEGGHVVEVRGGEFLADGAQGGVVKLEKG